MVGIDTGFYRDGWLFNAVKKSPLWISKDIRDITEKDLEGFEAVVHLAELFRLADQASLLQQPDLALHRMKALLTLHGVEG